MKYSEYLKAVKARLATPEAVWAPDGSIHPHPLCYANGDVLIEHQIAARQAQDTAARGQVEEHHNRLDTMIGNLMGELNRQLPANQYTCMYPTAVYALAVHRGEPNPPPPVREWGQKIRHELLDTWIAEAEQEERAHD